VSPYWGFGISAPPWIISRRLTFAHENATIPAMAIAPITEPATIPPMVPPDSPLLAEDSVLEDGTLLVSFYILICHRLMVNTGSVDSDENSGPLKVDVVEGKVNGKELLPAEIND